MFPNFIIEDKYIVVPPKKVQSRVHNKKRINKKWLKQYGYKHVEVIKNDQILFIEGRYLMNQHTYALLKNNEELENKIKNFGTKVRENK